MTLEQNNMMLFSPQSENRMLFWVGLPAALLVTCVNFHLLWIVWMKAKTKAHTLVDQLIGADCLISLMNIPLVLQAARIMEAPCWFR